MKGERHAFLFPVLSFVLALALAGLAGPPSRLMALRPAAGSTSNKCAPLASWTADFPLSVFDETVAASSDTKTVDLALAKGKPRNVRLTNEGKRTFLDEQGNEVVVNFYSGFPTRKERGATTVTAESFRRPVAGGGGIQSHFGLWVIITAECCQDWCYIQLILKSTRTLKRSGVPDISLANVAQPELDAGTIDPATKPCGGPNFPLNPSPNKDRSGFTDYPGLPCKAGDTITVGDQTVTLEKDDVIEIQDSFRTFITCSGHYVGFVDWGWSGKAVVGNHVGTAKLTVDGDNPTFTGIGDPTFQPAVDQAQALTK